MAEKGLEEKVAALEKEVQRLKDIEAIRKVEHAYNYYLVMWMPNEIIDLFAWREDTTLEWARGTFYGKDGLRRFFGNINPNQDPEFMHQMMHLSDVIDIAEDGKTGKGRWWGFGAMALPAGDKGVMQAFACGVYENDFIKEGGIWKLWKIKWVPVYSGTPARGWVAEERVSQVRPGDKDEETRVPDWWEPDKPAKGIAYSYPSGYILPFHFNHPVTGKPTSEGERNRRVKGVER